jgi:hypothetical protein
MVVSRIAIAGFAIGRADAVTKLRDLQGGPVELRQRGNQTGNHAGLSHTPRMSANYHDCHTAIFAGFMRFKHLKTTFDAGELLFDPMAYN